METIYNILNNAYVLFSFLLGLYAILLAGQNLPLSGNFWGAMWINTGLAAAIYLAALIMTVQGLRPIGPDPNGTGENIERVVYYLYGIYFIISLPGVFAIMRGNDNRRAALFFGGVAIFNGLAAYRAGNVLVTGWEKV